MTDFVMPVLGADMEAATLVAWHRQPGDRVHRGDTIAEVDTDKGVIDVEAFTSGVLERILVPVGTKVRVGTVMATIREEGTAVAAAPPETGEWRSPAAVKPPSALPTAAPAFAAGGRLRMSPAARRRARELGVDPAQVSATGSGGAITRQDVEQAAAAASTEVGGARVERMRQAIAAAMSRSNREIPHYYLETTIDLHRSIAWLAATNADRPVEKRLLPGVLLLKATAVALRDVPELNAVWDGGRVVHREQVHLGVAISLRGGGLVVLALHDTASRPVDVLMESLRDLTIRARTGRMKSSELADSTLTVTSLGDRGVDAVFGVIYPPQVALVGFGRIRERPWADAGELHVRPTVTATLAADHRASDGHRGGLYLDAIDRLLQEPEKL